MANSNHSKRVRTRTPDREKAASTKCVEDPSKTLADNIKKRLDHKEAVKRTTVGVYSLRVSDGLFGVPFFSLNDELALQAQKELLPQANLYCVGDFCLLTGKVTSRNPRVVLDK